VVENEDREQESQDQDVRRGIDERRRDRRGRTARESHHGIDQQRGDHGSAG
jgi:hypothetical protein